MQSSQWVDFAVIKQRITIEQILSRYGCKLRRNSAELRGTCPIHQGEGRNTFQANTEKNIFHCFSCRAKGNVLDLVAAMERCSIRDAALRLQDWFSLTDGTEGAAPAAPASRDSSEAAAATAAVNQPLDFRLKGIDSRHPYLAERGIEFETAEYFGVGLFAGRGTMHNRIVVPIEDEAGQLLAYAGRAIDGSQPKYKLPTGFHKSQVVFNLPRAKEESAGERVVVVEGFFDCMKVTQAAVPAVALMGCCLSPHQEQLIADHFQQAIVMLDGDEAGRAAAGEVAARLARRVWTRIAEVPTGLQPDQLSSADIRALLP